MLTGVLVEISREGVTLVATDSYRLAVRDLVATRRRRGEGDRARARAVGGRPCRGRRSRRATIEILVDESQVSFQVGGLMLTSRLIEGEFPNYRQLLPEHTRAG